MSAYFVAVGVIEGIKVLDAVGDGVRVAVDVATSGILICPHPVHIIHLHHMLLPEPGILQLAPMFHPQSADPFHDIGIPAGIKVQHQLLPTRFADHGWSPGCWQSESDWGNLQHAVLPDPPPFRNGHGRRGIVNSQRNWKPSPTLPARSCRASGWCTRHWALHPECQIKTSHLLHSSKRLPASVSSINRDFTIPGPDVGPPDFQRRHIALHNLSIGMGVI